MSSNSSPHTHFTFFFLFICLISFTTIKANTAAVVPSVPAVYLFGDSLADVGNNDYLKLSVLKADFPHNGVDYAGGQATGRFSNGKNSADFIAENLGVPTSPPYLSLPSNTNNTDAFFKGLNFASGGAGVLDSTNAGQCLTFNKQIDYFTTVYTDLVQQVGSTKTQSHLSKSIFAFIIGSNDILTYTRSIHSITPQQLVDSLISTLTGQLKTIYNLGARKFAFVGTGLIGCCPSMRLQNTGDCNPDANNVSHLYATGVASLLKELKSQLPDMNYSFFNSSNPLQKYLQNPATYGFTEVKAACCGQGNLNAKVACLPLSSLCSNRSNHVFWDLFHPTEATAKLLSTAFFQGSPPIAYPINVKQLSNL